MLVLRLAALAALAAASAAVPISFKLADATGRDLVAAAAQLAQLPPLSKEHRLWAKLSPVAPLQLELIWPNASRQSIRFRLERSVGAIAPGAKLPESVAAQPVFKSSDGSALLSAVGSRLDGVIRVGDEMLDVEADPATGELWFVEESEETARRLRFAPDELERWTGCFKDDTTTRAFSMGVAMGSALRNRFASNEEAVEWMQANFAKANLAYLPQLNIVLQIADAHISESSDAARPAWDYCSLGLDSQLRKFQEWDQPTPQGLWHLFDDCYDEYGDGSVGIANIGDRFNGMCQINKLCYRQPEGDCEVLHSNTGVTWRSTRTWKTFAHEVGHNFGADHSFDDGQGRTGGIMDYGDGTYQGIFQFNSQYTRAEICRTVSLRVNQSCAAITLLQAQCGNGIVEAGEECECEQEQDCSFCLGCSLQKGKECTPAGPDAQCCDSDGMFRPTSSTCSLSEGTGFCQQGTCTPTWCTGGHSNFGDFCGLQADDECKVRCQLEGACSDLDGWTWSPDRVPVNWQTDGTLCASGLGTCQSGSCVVAPADTAEAPDDPDDRFTAAGCSCRESWTYRGETCQDGCCNPDSDAGGDWCFTKGDCDGVNWGYCAASNATRPVRSNMLGGFQDEVMQTDAAYRSAAGWAGVVLLGALLGLVF